MVFAAFAVKRIPNKAVPLAQAGRRFISSRGRSSVLTSGFQPTAVTDRGVYLGSTFLQYPPEPLPQLDASVLFEPRTYCRRTADPSSPTSISGGEAAKRLLEGRKILFDVMREDLHGTRDSELGKQYILQGHGIPAQLLQHHVDRSMMWMGRLSPDDPEATLQIEADVGSSNADRVTIHYKDEGSWGAAARTTEKWPALWQNDLDLYTTVMKRIGEKLSQVLIKPDPIKGLDDSTASETPTLKCWKISVQSNQMMPLQLAPVEIGLVPIIQCIPMSSLEGRMRILLQGPVTGKDDDDAIASIMFDAVYDIKQNYR